MDVRQVGGKREDFAPNAKPKEPALIIDAPDNTVVVEDDMSVIDAVNQAAQKDAPIEAEDILKEAAKEKEKDLVH